MRRTLARWLPVAISLLFSAQAYAAVDRFVFEDGTNATVTTDFSGVTSGYRVLMNNGSTVLVPHTCAASVCARAKPSADTEGMLLDDIGSYQVWACVSTGTFTGTGAVEIYTFTPYGGTGQKWGYVFGKDKTPPSGSGLCVMLVQDRNSFAAPGARIAARANAVGVSTAAPTLEVRILGCRKALGFVGGCFAGAAADRPLPLQRYARTWQAPPRRFVEAFVLPRRRELLGEVLA